METQPVKQVITRKKAKALGLGRYFTGVPCKRGHASERYTASGKCVECDKEAQAKRYRANAEARRAASLKHYYENHEEAKEKRRLYSRRNVQSNRDRANKWARENPSRMAARNMARNAQKLQAAPSWAIAEEIAWFYDVAAEETARTGEPHAVDHIIPLKGKTVCGLHVHTNLQILTKMQNSMKGNRLLEGYAGC